MPGALALIGLVGLGLGGYALLKSLRTGTARLRGGRKITRERNPRLFWTNVIALCVLLALSLWLLFLAASR